MFTHEFWLIFSIGAYFVCEVLPIVRDVIYHNMRPERVTDETRMLKDTRNRDMSIGDVETYMFSPETYDEELLSDHKNCTECGDLVQVMADDQVIATHRVKDIAQYTETTYDDDFDVYDRDIEDGF